MGQLSEIQSQLPPPSLDCNPAVTAEADPKRRARRHQFDELQRLCGDSLWSDQLPAATLTALQDYKGHRLLPNGLRYGDSVRNLHVEGKSPENIEAELSERNCQKIDDVIHDPGRNNQAVTDSEGRPLPMRLFMCPDGGVVRLKPRGEPGNKMRPQPTVVKYVRYPYDTTSTGFDEEAFKVDQDGNSIPKFPRHLGIFFPDNPKLQGEIADAWAEDAHTDLYVPRQRTDEPDFKR